LRAAFAPIGISVAGALRIASVPIATVRLDMNACNRPEAVLSVPLGYVFF
jgi:hypothetical protein